MAENKFIQHLKGTETAGSVLEIKNQATPATFGNMPAGTSNPNTAYADARGDATAVLKGTDAWKLNGSSLELASRVYGDGRDFTDTYTASGSSLWVNATYTFGSAKIFGANTKWVLKLCGANLLSAVADTIDFSLIIKFGSTPLVTKTFTVAEQANNFCQQFVIDFNEWTQNVLKATSGDTLTIQLLCGDSTASATIYNGMTTLTALQRRVDGDVVASDTSTFDDLEQGKVDKVSTPSIVYGTDEDGAQTTYGLDEFGQVDDVQIDGVSIVQDKIADIPMATYLADYVLKTGDNMTGALRMVASPLRFAAASTGDGIQIRPTITGATFSTIVGLTDLFTISTSALYPVVVGGQTISLGQSANKWNGVYTTKLNNGYDIAVPVTNSPETLALKSEVDLAANSGRMITDQGVWYAKMDALGTIPSSAEVEGRNYADFTQVDGNNDPIIVIYTYTSGAWVQTETITPPSAYDGYVPITSKIWDIPEQTGQQGGRILWNHQSKEFTPYPQIISFEDAALTGNSTVAMPLNPTNDNIANKGYVDSAVAASAGGVDLFDMKQKDCTMNRTGWALADGNWKTAVEAYTHLAADYDNITSYLRPMGSVSGVNYYADPARDVPGAAHEYAFSSFDESTVTTVYSDDSAPTGGVDHFYNGSGSGATDLGVVEGSGQASTSVKSTIAYEKIGNTTVVYFTAADGHRICLPDQETNIDAIFAATGVAWYYILDEENQRFKLPRTQHGFVAYRDTVGAYVAPALPNIKGLITSNNWAGNAAADSALYPTGDGTNSDEQGHGPNAIGFNAHRHNAIYQDSATVQPPATQMYLYFYVGA